MTSFLLGFVKCYKKLFKTKNPFNDCSDTENLLQLKNIESKASIDYVSRLIIGKLAGDEWLHSITSLFLILPLCHTQNWTYIHTRKKYVPIPFPHLSTRHNMHRWSVIADQEIDKMFLKMSCLLTEMKNVYSFEVQACA